MMNGPTVAICGECVVVAVSMMATHMGLTIDSAPIYQPPPIEASPAMLSGGEFVIAKRKDEG